MTRSKAVEVKDMVVYRYVHKQYAPSLDEFDNPIRGSGRTAVNLEKYKVLSQTPKGAWIDGPEGRKFINMESRRRFACYTKEEALDSFIARKERHCEILQSQLKNAEKALRLAKIMKENPEKTLSYVDTYEVFTGHFNLA